MTYHHIDRGGGHMRCCLRMECDELCTTTLNVPGFCDLQFCIWLTDKVVSSQCTYMCLRSLCMCLSMCD